MSAIGIEPGAPGRHLGVRIGAKVRVGGSISARFGGAISLQDRSAFELRDYPRKEMLAGTLCLRR